MRREYYDITVAGVKRSLPVCPVNESLYIAGFVIFGDVELTRACARDLLKKAPPFDLLITAESKGIPLAHEMTAQAGKNKYVLARKAPKLYMKNVVAVEVQSITTVARQTLYLDQADLDAMKGKRILIVDDVISTGESIAALETLVKRAGGETVGKMAILAEGEAKDREDILYLEYLPLFDGEGNKL